MDDDRQKPYGLAFSGPSKAEELEEGQIVVFDGHVVEAQPDPERPGQTRLVLVRALGPPPGTDPDQREIELICPSDMLFGTAEPHNIELAPPPPRPS